MNYSITRYGKELDKSLYTWDEKTKTLSTNENNLVLDFSDIDGCTFNTGYDCTFETGSGCTFDTGSDCTFDTGYDCTFETGSGCISKTGSDCIFKTGSGCISKTGSDCIFKTGSECVVVRRDVYEVIELVKGQKIKLNGYGIKGFTIIEEDEEEVEKAIKLLEDKGRIKNGKIII